MSKVFVNAMEDGIFELKIDDLENENRLEEELFSELMTALINLTNKQILKVLILTGREKVFCAGASLDFLKKLAEGKADEKDYLFALPNQILNFPVPVIAAMEGHAIGGGLMLALYCDILIASQSSRYGVNFTNLGFTPGMGTTFLLPALVGYPFANEMILTAKLYKGSELKERGLFNYVVPHEEVMNTALDIARRIAEKPRRVLKMLKNTLSLSRRQALQEAYLREELMQKVCFASPETAAIIEATYLT